MGECCLPTISKCAGRSVHDSIFVRKRCGGMGAAAAAGSAQVGPQNASAVWILPAHDDTFLYCSKRN